MRRAIALAERARANGNHPFGALLTDDNGDILLEAENSVVTERDVTGHAELNLVRLASKQFDAEFLATCSLYTSTEPCPMCAGAIFWSNIRRVVFGLSESRLYEMVADDTSEALRMPANELFALGKKAISVVGPVLADEAKEVHKGFW